MRVGFACLWTKKPEATWSHTPWSLRGALRQQADVVDLGPFLPSSVQTTLKLLHARRAAGRWTSTWRQATLTDVLCQRRLRAALDVSACDAVVQIQDLATLSTPFYLVQDLSYDVLIDCYDRGLDILQFPALSRSALERRRGRQRRIYERASGIFAMSRWFADSLVNLTELPPSKVHVVPPGATALASTPGGIRAGKKERVPPPGGRRARLLFVGRDFHRKGGDIVVAAHRYLRSTSIPDLTLTVAGPSVWPLQGDVPEGVWFLGEVPPVAVARLLDEHDLFVLPSRFEAFGIAFVEALGHGTPCIGRNAFAMPEMIEPGRNGALVDSDDPISLAEAIQATLADDEIYATCAREAERVAARYSWSRAAEDMLGIMAAAGGAPSRSGGRAP